MSCCKHCCCCGAIEPTSGDKVTPVQKAVFISAGHSDSDCGAVTRYNGAHVTEASVVLELRNLVAQELLAYGCKVTTDGTASVNKSLKEAIAMIKSGTLAVELHCNASDNKAAQGVEAYGLPKVADMCKKLSKSVADTLGFKLRGDSGWKKQEDSARGTLGFVKAGGIILELFFLTNDKELEIYLNNKVKVARAIARVLVDESVNA